MIKNVKVFKIELPHRAIDNICGHLASEGIEHMLKVMPDKEWFAYFYIPTNGSSYEKAKKVLDSWNAIEEPQSIDIEWR